MRSLCALGGCEEVRCVFAMISTNLVLTLSLCKQISISPRPEHLTHRFPSQMCIVKGCSVGKRGWFDVGFHVSLTPKALRIAR